MAILVEVDQRAEEQGAVLESFSQTEGGPPGVGCLVLTVTGKSYRFHFNERGMHVPGHILTGLAETAGEFNIDVRRAPGEELAEMNAEDPKAKRK